MIKWTPAAPDVGCRSLEDLDHRFSILEIGRSAFSKEPQPVIVFPREVRNAIMMHVNSASTELGGLLLGSAYSGEGSSDTHPVLVRITNSIESVNYQSTGVSLRMDTEIWSRAKPFVENQEIVVGWYHSHPNLGAFFSGTDRRNQAAVFYHPYSIGLVVDPIRHEEKWFIGQNSSELSPDLVREAL